KSHTGQGLPGGNAIGQFGYAPGTPGTPGIAVGTIFDDNATRNIFDPTTAGVNGNSATDYIGYFRPEGSQFTDTLPALGRADTLTNFLALEMSKGEINGPWTLQVTNYTSTAPATGSLNEFSLQFSTGMSTDSPKMIDQTLVPGAIGNTFPTKPPSAPSTGVGPGLVLAIDNTLGPDSPYQGRIYAAYVIYEMNTDPNQHVNPTSNTDIALSYSDDGGQTWVYAGIVNDDAATSDGYSGSSIDSESAYTS